MTAAEQRLATLVRMWNAGASVEEIAVQTGYAANTITTRVSWLRRRKGVDLKMRKRGRRPLDLTGLPMLPKVIKV